MDEPNRDLVQHSHAEGPEAGELRLRGGLEGQGVSLRGLLQSDDGQAVQVELRKAASGITLGIITPRCTRDRTGGAALFTFQLRSGRSLSLRVLLRSDGCALPHDQPARQVPARREVALRVNVDQYVQPPRSEGGVEVRFVVVIAAPIRRSTD